MNRSTSMRELKRTPRWSVLADLIPWVILPLFTWFLYYRALGLAFFWDDPSNSRWFHRLSLWSPETHYYRPFVFLVWRTMLGLFGYSPSWFHALNLLVHSANALLVWALVRLISGWNLLALVTALLFTAYPFSYQAVAYVGALFHPMATLFVLAALIAYELSRRSRPALFWVSHIFLVLAYFSHESAFVAPVLLAVLDLLQGRARGRSLSFFLAAAIVLLLWLAVPKSVGSIAHWRKFPLQSLPAVLQHGFYALRAAFYPLIPLQPVLGSVLPRDGRMVSLALATVGGLLVLVAARLRPLRRPVAFAAVWMVCYAVPVVLFLDTPHVREGHRLFYGMSVGSALLWGSLLTTPVHALQGLGWPVAARREAAVAVPFLLLLSQSGWFVQERISDYERASALVRGVVQSASEIPADRELIYVNLPQFFAPRANHAVTSPDLYGFREVWVIPAPYTTLEDLIRINGGPRRNARGVFVKALRPHWLPYGTEITLDELRELLTSSEVLLFDPARWDFVPLSAHWFPTPEANPPPKARLSQSIHFGETIALEGFQASWGTEEVQLTLWWRSLNPTTQSFTAFTHLYDAAGNLVAQHDGIPGQGFVPTHLWRRGDLIKDVHHIPLPNHLGHGPYTLSVGLYELASMQRVPVTTGNGRAFQHDAVPLEQKRYPW